MILRNLRLVLSVRVSSSVLRITHKGENRRSQLASRVLKKSFLQAAQKDPGARRVKNRRAETYLRYVVAR